MKGLKRRVVISAGIVSCALAMPAGAQLLDQNVLEWVYEPVTFASRSGQYLPDFVVTDAVGGVVYVEVKPTAAQALAAIHDRMPVIWSSEPSAAMRAVWPQD